MSRFDFLETASPPLPQGNIDLTGDIAGRYLEQATRALDRGESEKALNFFGRVIAEDHSSLPAWHGQVIALIDLGKSSDALVWADQALGVFPDHPNLLASKAMAWDALFDAARAKGFADAAFSSNATMWAWLARGCVLATLSPEVSENCFNHALTFERKSFVAIRAGRAFLRAGEMARAIAWLTRARDMDPKNPWIWSTLVETYRALGETDKENAAQEQLYRLDHLRSAPKADSGFIARMRRWFKL